MAVDPTLLEQQLDAAKKDRDHLDRVIAWLEDGVAIFAGEPPAAELEEPEEEPEPAGDEPLQLPPAPEPPQQAQRPRPPARAGARDNKAKTLAVVLGSNRPLAFAEIVEQVGASAHTVRDIVQKLVKDGQIQATGATKKRRYSRIQQEGFHTEARAKQEASKGRNAAKVADGIGRVVFRDQVAKAIAADPSITQDRLARDLDADTEDVAEACAWLVEHHQVKVDDDGGYSRESTRRARLRAAA